MRRAPTSVALAALVFAGGCLGVAARVALTAPLEGAGFAPALGATIAINVAGGFLLGVLVGTAAARPRLRAFAGTGILGGFTTYSALAVLTVDGIGRGGGDLLLAVAGSLAAALAGAAAALAALALTAHPRGAP